MKKIAFALAALCLFACSNDDNSDSQPENAFTGELAGNWKTTHIGYDDMMFAPGCEMEGNLYANFYYHFAADGTVKIYNTCEAEGEIDDETPYAIGTYTKNKSTLTITILGHENKAVMKDYDPDDNRIEWYFDLESEGVLRGYFISVEEQNP